MKGVENMTNKKARFIKHGNIKLGNMWTFSTLYGDYEYETEFGKVKGTCGQYCKGCKNDCYVKKSYRYPSVIKSHAINTISLINSVMETEKTLIRQIKNAKNKPSIIRIHQSGEMLNKYEMAMWINIAKEFPNITFYTYTKAFDIVEPFLLNIPLNLYINISVWHEYGIKEYKEMEKHPNIKAFVYMDGFNYNANGLNIQTTCKAYEGGKLNHAITCDKCKKCFTYNKSLKIIGCESH